MQISTHIMFSGNCREAFEFYQNIFGGELTILSYGDSPTADQMPQDWHDKVAHISLLIDGMEIAGADILPDQYQPPKGFNLLIQLQDIPEAERIFNALSSGGSVTMALGETYWSPCFGILTDRFGISWEINYNDEQEN